MRKVYDRARTPYQRVLESGVLSLPQQEALARQYQGLNPVVLLARIKQSLEGLWALADTKTNKASVTVSSEAMTALR